MKQTTICEICSESDIILDRHHITSKTNGGTNEPSNIVSLCCNCHRRVHMGMFVLEGRFLTTDGYELIYHTQNDPNVIDRENPEVYIFNKS